MEIRVGEAVSRVVGVVDEVRVAVDDALDERGIVAMYGSAQPLRRLNPSRRTRVSRVAIKEQLKTGSRHLCLASASRGICASTNMFYTVFSGTGPELAEIVSLAMCRSGWLRLTKNRMLDSRQICMYYRRSHDEG